MPKVSVILSTYNDAAYIQQAIDSILAQTFSDFELILINDGSTDDTSKLLNSYKDQRIVHINHDIPRTLTISLNEGLDIATGEFIARMDGDDISSPERLEKQLAYFRQHPETDILGTHAHYLRQPFDRRYIRSFPTTHSMIVWYMFMDHPLIHPTVMMRRRVLDLRHPLYNPQYHIGQDFELWNYLLDKVRFANLPDVLMTYRVHKKSLTKTKSLQEDLDTYQPRFDNIQKLLGREIDSEVVFRLHYINRQRHLTFEQVQETMQYALELYQALLANDYFLAEETKKVYDDLMRRIMFLCQHSNNIISFARMEPINPVLKRVYQVFREVIRLVK